MGSEFVAMRNEFDDWWIVNQPDGRYACFSTYVEDFDRWGMKGIEVQPYLVSHWNEGELRAQAKRMPAFKASIKNGYNAVGDLSLWDESLERIAKAHGVERLRERMAEMGFPDYPIDGIVAEFEASAPGSK